MNKIDADVTAIDYDRLKSLVAVYQVLNGYKYGLSYAVDTYIDLNSDCGGSDD